MKALLLGAAILIVTLPAQAETTVFQDNFDANGGGLNTVPAGWTVSDGTVDVIGADTAFDYIPGSGKFVDLDGTTGNAGTLSVALDLMAGQHYRASFDLAGSQVRDDVETVFVAFGGSSASFGLPRGAGWTRYVLDFMPESSGAYALSFTNAGGDDVGMLLDNVAVTTAVPEPDLHALMLGGLGLVGFMARRRARR